MPNLEVIGLRTDYVHDVFPSWMLCCSMQHEHASTACVNDAFSEHTSDSVA